MYPIVGISVRAWKAAAAPMIKAPPPRKLIRSVRKFWVAASDAPSRNALARNPTMATGTFGTRRGTPASGGSSTDSMAWTGFRKRHTHIPKSRVSGAYTKGMSRRLMT